MLVGLATFNEKTFLILHHFHFRFIFFLGFFFTPAEILPFSPKRRWEKGKISVGAKKRIKILLRTVSTTVDSHKKVAYCTLALSLNAYACITLAIKRGLMSYLEAVDKVCLHVSLRT